MASTKASLSRSPGRIWRPAPSIASCELIGADVVGMSTVPETIVAVHSGLKTIGLSVITDMCLPDALQPANVEEIIATAGRAAPDLIAIVRGIVDQFGQTRIAAQPLT